MRLLFLVFPLFILAPIRFDGQDSTVLTNTIALQYTDKAIAKVEAGLGKELIQAIRPFSHTIHLRKTILR